LAAGKLFDKEMEVVAGAAIAKKAKLKVGSSFVGQHGANGAAHEEHPYTVTGILAPTHTIIDHLLLSNIETVWEVHHHHHEEEPPHEAEKEAPNNAKLHHHDHDHDHGHDHDHEEHKHEGHAHETNTDSLQITAALLKFHTPMAMMTMPRIINSNTNMQAANPAIEVRRLTKLLSIGTDTLKAVGLGIMVVSALSIFIALFLRLKERSYELALMRSMGCPRRGLLWLLLGEGIGIATAGAVLGLLVSRLGIVLLQQSSAGAFNLVLSAGWLAQEGWLLLATLGIGALAALIPAIKAFQLNISKTLANEG
jgi:putative ABC transport system permease protein